MSDWFSFVAKKKDSRPAIPSNSYKRDTNNTQPAAAILDINDSAEAMEVEEHTGSETSIQRIIKSWTGKR